jgi:RNA polymerase sigma factor (sigma-70 family)
LSGQESSSTAAKNDEGSDLVRRFLQEDREAVARVEASIRRVVRFKGYYIPYGARADIVQEALGDLVAALGRDPGGVRDLEALARTIAHRQCVTWVRRHRARGEPAAHRDPVADGPEGSLLARERLGLALEVLARLKEPCRELLRLRYVEEMEFARIGRLLGRSEGALRTQMWDCMKEARGILDGIQRGGTDVQAGGRGAP